MNDEMVKKEVRVKSLGTVVEGQKTAYVFTVSNLQSQPFQIRDRFSNIEKLHKELKKKEPAYKKDKDIKFPTKKIFTTSFIEERQYGLEFFFYGLFNNEELVECNTVKMYLNMYWNSDEGVNYQYESKKNHEFMQAMEGELDPTIKNNPTLQGLQYKKFKHEDYDFRNKQGQQKGVLSYFGNTNQEQFTRAAICGTVTICACCCSFYCCCCF